MGVRAIETETEPLLAHKEEDEKELLLVEMGREDRIKDAALLAAEEDAERSDGFMSRDEELDEGVSCSNNLS
jgi:DNA-binding IclR family transcriptional regulator